MKLTIYEQPETIDHKDLYARYPDGAVVFYILDILKNKVQILATAPYDENMGVHECRQMLAKEYPDYVDGHEQCMLIAPTLRENIDITGRSVCSRDKFFSDFSKEIVGEKRAYSRVYRAEAKQMQIVYYLDRSGDAVIYYGSSIEPIDRESIAEKIGRAITILPYAEYRERRRKYIKLHEEDKQDGKRSTVKVVNEIKKWLKEVDYNNFVTAITSKVVGQPELEIILACIFNYLECIARGRSYGGNILLAAPSGCGKTETYRALRAFFQQHIPEMPVYQIDMTSITEEGFKGSDTKAMVKPLLEQESTNGIGIAFLDEFDKKLMPTYASSGQNVNAVVQAQILTTVEGRIFAADNKTIDTTNTLFIALGSFDECRKKKKEIIRHVGFGQENEGGADHYTSITRKDMIKLGASYELIGRFPIIVNFQPLEDAVVDNIIDMMVRAMRRDLLIYIQISPEMRQDMHASANSKYGCRLLKGMLYEAVMPAYGKLLALGYDKQEHKIYIERRDAVYILKKSEIQEKVVLENDELEI